MKSIVEEASSIEKAIAQAWKRAGKPNKFTISVFQEPEKNFFGMTTAPAKIGFMFEERAIPQKATPRAAAKSQAQPQKQPRREQHKKTEAAPAQESNGSNRFWSPEMIASVKTWLTKTLKVMNKGSVDFSIKPNRYHLKVQFSRPLSDDSKQEKAIFRSFAHLIMQAQRSEIKKALKHHKVILMS